MGAFSRFLRALLYVLLLLLFLGFAIKNTSPVVVRYYLGATWQAPLVVIVLVTFALGAAAGALASVAYVMRQRRELLLLRRRIPTLPEPPSSDGTAS
jgi:uncharacterized integral membrane protein